MEPLFKFNVNDMNVWLPQMKIRLMSGVGDTQIAEQILIFLRNSIERNRDIIVGQLTKFDVISAICNAMQTSDENFVKVVLEIFDLISVHAGFYENHAAIDAVQSMLRLSYCVNKSLKDSTLFENLVQGVCGILVRSSKLCVDIDNVCDLQQIMLFLKNLDIRDSQKDKTTFAAAAILNVVLQQTVFDESENEEIVIDVCHDALKSMIKFVKYGDDDNTILQAAAILCGICAGGSRIDLERESQTDDKFKNVKVCQKKIELLSCIYNTTMNIIIPYVKDANLSGVDSVELHKNLISCLNNLYQMKNYNHDNLSNHLTANGYLKYFLLLIVRLPNNLQRSTCTLLSRILGILGKMTFCRNTNKFVDIMREGLLDLPKKSTDQWSGVIKHHGKDADALMVLLYYHFHGTRECDMVSLELLVARVMLLSRSKPVSVLILKPLWLLFAATSISHSCPNTIYNYEIATTRLMNKLSSQYSDISEIYTHHIDLLHYCLKCPVLLPSLVNQVLDLWLIESGGDIKPLLPFNYDKVVRRLLAVLHTGGPQRIISLAVNGLRDLIQIGKDDQRTEQIANIVWDMLPIILSSHQSNNVAHIEAVLGLANIIRPHTLPIHVITHTANSIVNITLRGSTDSKFMTLVVTQAYVLLVAAVSRKSFKVLQTYLQKFEFLKKLYIYGLSQERSELSAISIKLLAFVIHVQNKWSIECKQTLEVRVGSLAKMLTCARNSPCCATNEMQFICELLAQRIDGSAVVVEKITNTDDRDMLISLYEILHIIHFQKYLTERDIVYQCLETVLHFCNTVQVITLSHLCTLMSNYGLILNVVNMRYVSLHFVEFVVSWLRYRKASCSDLPWNSRSLFKTPFDEVLDRLGEYSAIVNNKGLKNAHLNLERALSQFK